jgi:hypothetical protein
MVLLVLSIGFIQNLLELLADVMNPLNDFGGFVSLRMNMGSVCLCGERGSAILMGPKGWNPNST